MRVESSKSSFTEWAPWAEGCPSELISLRGRPRGVKEARFVCCIVLVDVRHGLFFKLIVVSN